MVFLVSYDWHLLHNALPLVYAEADVIYLALDKKRLTWAGNPFKFDEKAFYAMLEHIDTEHKIKVYEDDFFVETLSPMQCEVRERNLLAKQMGEGGWHIQLDADEYFIDFKSFANYLRNKSHLLKEGKKGINIRCFWIPLFKKTNQGYFYVNYRNKLPESIAIATNKPVYE
ncbi:MAG: hypothetical protein HC912_07550, partial [Saprospiraceae bacterium]|nr:hypothetical protein [Saprospiraceae bacterium]